MRRQFAVAAVLAVLGLTHAAPAAQSQAPLRDPDVIFVPTPQPVVDAMLKLAKVGKSDVVYDLGCGDGIIVISAAKQYGARGVGIDINPVRIKESNANAIAAGVTDLVTFRNADIFADSTNFSEATVVTLYLLPSLNVKLMPKLLKELKPGTRIVSHSFDMGEWKPDQVVEVENRQIYLWTVPKS
jgi:predicted RNA methylase